MNQRAIARRAILAAALACVPALLAAQSPRAAAASARNADPARWQPLLRANKDAEALPLCQTLAASAVAAESSQGHLCLANLELRTARRGATAPGSRTGVEWPEATVDAALRHLDRALAVTPEDLSIHQTRLDLLMAAGRWDALAPTIDASVRSFPGDGMSAWLAVAATLFELDRAEECLRVARILERARPFDSRMLGITGAALALLDRDEEALSYLSRAVQASPEDPAERWNLARQLDLMGRDDEAAASYARWSELEMDESQRARGSCIYSRFVETKRGDLARACRLQEQFCEADERSACAALASSATSAASVTPAQADGRPEGDTRP